MADTEACLCNAFNIQRYFRIIFVKSRKNLEVDGMTDERTNVFLSGQHLLVRLPEDWGIPSVTPVDTILQSKKD